MDGPFYFNDSTFNMMRIDYTIPINNIEVWKLVNETMVAYPFHIHDVQFYILDRNGNPPAPQGMGRKDVVLVPSIDTVRFITMFTDFADTTIPYMYHCHILMYEDDGMMGQFVVTPNLTGIDEIKGTGSISIFPNPADDVITISNSGFGNSGEMKLTITDLYGRIFIAKKISGRNLNFHLSTKEFPNGIYFLTVADAQNSLSQKIIVLH